MIPVKVYSRTLAQARFLLSTRDPQRNGGGGVAGAERPATASAVDLGRAEGSCTELREEPPVLLRERQLECPLSGRDQRLLLRPLEIGKIFVLLDQGGRPFVIAHAHPHTSTRIAGMFDSLWRL